MTRIALETEEITADGLSEALTEAGAKLGKEHAPTLDAAAKSLMASFQEINKEKRHRRLALRLVTDQFVVLWVGDVETPVTDQSRPATPDSEKWCQTCIRRMVAAQVYMMQTLYALMECRANHSGAPIPGPDDEITNFGQTFGSGLPQSQEGAPVDPCALEAAQLAIAIQDFEAAVQQMEFACNAKAGMGG